MDLYQGIFLGLVQGLTEFLPVSSSGHLVFFQHFFGIREPGILFDVSVHAGTLVAVCLVFINEIWAMVKSAAGSFGRTTPSGLKSLYDQDMDFKMMVLIAAGSIPTAAIGFYLNSMIDILFRSVELAAACLLITGGLLFMTHFVKGPGRGLKQMRIADAMIIGTVQGLAVFPGISRSGSTIAAALFCGLDREVSGKFSFLLSLPAVAGALLLSLFDLSRQTTTPASTIFAGAFIAGISGFFALKLLLGIVKKGRLSWFAPYCIILGLVFLLKL